MTRLAVRLRRISSWQGTLFAALGALGFLIAVQLQSEAPRVRYTTQERAPLVATARELQQQQDALKGAILEERDRIGTLERSGQGSAEQVTSLNERLATARLAAGLVPLRGPGVVIRLEDGAPSTSPGADGADSVVTARDVRTVVEELWLAGAEAIAVDGERIVVLSAILDIGGSVLVNSAYLAPPYDIAAIGDEGLYARLSASPGFVDFATVRAGVYGIRVRYAELTDVPIPAYAGAVNLRRSTPAGASIPAGASAWWRGAEVDSRRRRPALP